MLKQNVTHVFGKTYATYTFLPCQIDIVNK